MVWSGGPHAKRVSLTTRIRCGESWSARGRGRFLRWFGLKFLVLRGQETPDGFQVERLLRDYGVDRLWGGEGLIQARARWDPDQPDPERLLKILERLHRLALEIEGVMVPLTEDGGELSCPFCRAEIREEEPLARCEACYTPHHPSCFEENGGCALLGCENRSARTRSGRYPRKPQLDPKETLVLPANGVGAAASESEAVDREAVDREAADRESTDRESSDREDPEAPGLDLPEDDEQGRGLRHHEPPS